MWRFARISLLFIFSFLLIEGSSIAQTKDKIESSAAPTVAILPKERLKRAEGFYALNRDKDSQKELRYLLGEDPMNAEAYLILGKIRVRQGDRSRAIGLFKTAIFWNDWTKSSHESLDYAYVYLGKMYLKKGDCLQARKYLALVLPDWETQKSIVIGNQARRCFK
jgi:tetratricopeptide (TPR) repeat protein